MAGISDPAAWQAWLDHLQKWGIVSPSTAPRNYGDYGPPPPANENRTHWIGPTSQAAPGPLSSQISAADWAKMFPDITGRT